MAKVKFGKGKTIAIIVGLLLVLGVVSSAANSCHRVMDPEYAAQEDAKEAARAEQKAQREAEKAAKGAPLALTFTNMTVTVTPDESASKFTVTLSGYVKNDTPREISRTNLPKLKDGSNSIAAETDEQKLETEQTCAVTYSETLDWNSEANWSFDFPKDAQVEGLDGITDDMSAKFAALRSETEGTRAEAAERAAAEAEQKRIEREQAALQRTCYVTPNGDKYHSSKGCPSLSRSKNLIEMTVEEARSQGYEPCDRC